MIRQLCQLLLLFFAIAVHGQEKIIAEDPDDRYLVTLKPNPNVFLRKNFNQLFSRDQQTEIIVAGHFAFQLKIDFDTCRILDASLVEGDSGLPILSEEVVTKIQSMLKKNISINIREVGLPKLPPPETLNNVVIFTPMNWNKKRKMH